MCRAKRFNELIASAHVGQTPWFRRTNREPEADAVQAFQLLPPRIASCKHPGRFACRAAEWYPCLRPIGWLRQSSRRLTFAGEEITHSRMILTVVWSTVGT